MKRREFSLAWTTGLAASALGLAHAPMASAQGKKPEAGTDYIALDKAVAVEAPQGKIEVVEFFWYACPHCNAFEPKLEEWVKRLPKDVAFRRSPVMFRDDFVPLQKLYYALEALNRVDDMHRKVFYAIHVEKQQLNRDELIFTWATKQGLDKAKFTEAYNSFGVSTKVRKATQLQDAYKVSGVPAMGVAGRFYTDGTLAQSMDRGLMVVDSLVADLRPKAK